MNKPSTPVQWEDFRPPSIEAARKSIAAFVLRDAILRFESAVARFAAVTAAVSADSHMAHWEGVAEFEKDQARTHLVLAVIAWRHMGSTGWLDPEEVMRTHYPACGITFDGKMYLVYPDAEILDATQIEVGERHQYYVMRLSVSPVVDTGNLEEDNTIVSLADFLPRSTSEPPPPPKVPDVPKPKTAADLAFDNCVAFRKVREGYRPTVFTVCEEDYSVFSTPETTQTLDEVIKELTAEVGGTFAPNEMEKVVWRNGRVLAVIHRGKNDEPVTTRIGEGKPPRKTPRRKALAKD